MSEGKDVRNALERLRDGDTPIWPNRPVERVLVSEGLAACDEYEAMLRRTDSRNWSEGVITGEFRKVASILRKAGLL